ncbi:hypothetical protein A3D77_05410 [Candidatus Gottesmanbacteria bacterium RIFCSPHIGHO2_02_FULL_39_11]|uniref:ABC transporter substrate-binding protein n=1 Tax=Candidatus Gottesmanbacteria bacterium RIFCSPHIGHO2_02_FULL_39_11 TaxID=1798382 RepID=A0A1F5ZME3_9BACT|nr:MAG: hypothetical protein A3D77_05410 [Candidatus Gottesmanbacteria bacterium RIFCSPHIGHO2_02_FULL_39_11]
MSEIPDQNSNSSQPIFTGNAPSGSSSYAQTLGVEAPPDPSKQVFQEPSSSGDSPLPPPPFEEDNKKKYIIFGLFGLLFLFIVFLIISFLSSRFKGKTSSGPVTITYWGLWTEKEVMQLLIDDYQKTHPNVIINYQLQDKKLYKERLTAAIDRNEGPDIFRFHNGWGVMIASYLAPVPKTVYSDADFDANFYPVVKEDVNRGGNYYGIPLSIDGLVMFYNDDMLKSGNIPVPTTWGADFEGAAQKLTVREEDKIVTSGAALGLADNIDHFSDILSLMMLQNGTKVSESLLRCYSNQSGKEELLQSTTCGSDTLSYYHKFTENPNSVWNDVFESSLTSFASGKVAIIFAPSWEALNIKALNPNLNFKVAKVPQLVCVEDPCSDVYLASYWLEGVSKNSKNQAEAFDFLKYLTSRDVLQKKYEAEARLRKLFGDAPARRDMADTVGTNEYLKPLISEAPDMKSSLFVSRTIDGESGINARLEKYLKDAVNALNKGVGADTAIQPVDNGLHQVLDGYKAASAATNK